MKKSLSSVRVMPSGGPRMFQPWGEASPGGSDAEVAVSLVSAGDPFIGAERHSRARGYDSAGAGDPCPSLPGGVPSVDCLPRGETEGLAYSACRGAARLDCEGVPSGTGLVGFPK